MIRAILRSYLIAAIAIALVFGAWIADLTLRCDYDRRQVAPRRAATGIVLDEGFAVARPDEVLVVCESRHCVGPLCHDDLTCYCVPDAISTRAAQSLGPDARCTRDLTNQCRGGHCRDHLK